MQHIFPLTFIWLRFLLRNSWLHYTSSKRPARFKQKWPSRMCNEYINRYDFVTEISGSHGRGNVFEKKVDKETVYMKNTYSFRKHYLTSRVFVTIALPWRIDREYRAQLPSPFCRAISPLYPPPRPNPAVGLARPAAPLNFLIRKAVIVKHKSPLCPQDVQIIWRINKRKEL